MLIIEITGAPCSGKSTMLADCSGLDKQVSAKVVYGNPYAKRVSGYLQMQQVLFFCHGLLFTSVQLRRFLFMHIFSSESRPIHRLRLIFHTFLKLGRQVYLQRNHAHKAIIIDEGISHIPFNLALSEQDIAIFLALLPQQCKKNTVYCLFEPPSTLYKRLQQRGHKRLTSSDQAIKAFIVKNNTVFSVLQMKYKFFFEHYGEGKSAELKHFEEFILSVDAKKSSLCELEE